MRDTTYVRRYAGIKKYGDIYAFLDSLDKKKYPVDPAFVALLPRVRALFIDPLVAHKPELPSLSFNEPDEEGLVRFLCGTHGFDQKRVKNAITKLNIARTKASQRRMDSFFTTSAPKPKPKAKAGGKRKKGASAASGKAAAFASSKVGAAAASAVELMETGGSVKRRKVDGMRFK